MHSNADPYFIHHSHTIQDAKHCFPTLFGAIQQVQEFSILSKTNIKQNYFAVIHFAYSPKGKVVVCGGC